MEPISADKSAAARQTGILAVWYDRIAIRCSELLLEGRGGTYIFTNCLPRGISLEFSLYCTNLRCKQAVAMTF